MSHIRQGRCGMEEQALKVYTPQELQAYDLSVADIKAQVQKIQQVMTAVMKEGEHYGKIPGTNKPTLLKPGAEKLGITFRLEPDYILLPESIIKPDYLNYRIKCVLTHIHTGQRYASGMGSCNTREKKYRYRWLTTGVAVPGKYWAEKHNRDPKILIEAMEGPEGGPYKAQKTDAGQWEIHFQVENDDPGDLDNTILKMACKRAHVAAMLNATAASDIFTQDLEDMDDKPKGEKPKEKPLADKPKSIDKKQLAELEVKIKEIKASDSTFDDKRFVTEFCHIASGKLGDLPAQHHEEVTRKLQKRLEQALAVAAAQNDASAGTDERTDPV